MRSDQPPLEVSDAVKRESSLGLCDDIGLADVYLGLIEGRPDSDCLRNFLGAMGRGIPILIVTSAACPCPRWMVEQADRTVILGPGMPLAAVAAAMGRWAEWFFKRHPHLATRRRN
jgi:hypothetical protein